MQTMVMQLLGNKAQDPSMRRNFEFLADCDIIAYLLQQSLGANAEAATSVARSSNLRQMLDSHDRPSSSGQPDNSAWLREYLSERSKTFVHWAPGSLCANSDWVDAISAPSDSTENVNSMARIARHIWSLVGRVLLESQFSCQSSWAIMFFAT
jgi:hypothetical protein